MSAGVSASLHEVRARIAAACKRVGREERDVTLIAVSKLHPIESISAAYAAGARDFGENYAQELRDKAQALASLEGVRWHAIGPVQTKNAKYIAKAAFAFHALCDLDVAQELSRRRGGAPLRCFLELNVGAEATKAGLGPGEASAFADAVRALPGLQLVGLMALPPLEDSPEASRPHFRRLRELGHTLGLSQLSMGSTHDFEVAIEEGATHVRVGTAIFGERPTAP